MGKKKDNERFKTPVDGGQYIYVPGNMNRSPWLTNSQAYKKYIQEHYEKLQELKDIASGMNMWQPTVRNYRK